MFDKIKNAIDSSKTLVLMFEGPEGTVVQREVKPKGITPEQQLVAYCLRDRRELAFSIPQIIGVRYWTDIEE